MPVNSIVFDLDSVRFTRNIFFANLYIQDKTNSSASTQRYIDPLASHSKESLFAELTLLASEEKSRGDQKRFLIRFRSNTLSREEPSPSEG